MANDTIRTDGDGRQAAMERAGRRYLPKGVHVASRMSSARDRARDTLGLFRGEDNDYNTSPYQAGAYRSLRTVSRLVLPVPKCGYNAWTRYRNWEWLTNVQ